MRNGKKELSISLDMFYVYPLVFPLGQTYAFAAEKAVNLYPFKTNRDLFFICFAPGFHDVDCAGIPVTRDSNHFQWILYSGFQNIRGAGQDSFSCMYSQFHKPNFADSGIRIPLHADDLLNMFPCF